MAKSVEDNGGVYFAPAFTGLGAPHWDPYARGMIAGITRGVTSGHIARAALESIAFQVKDVMKAMENDAGIRINELNIDFAVIDYSDERAKALAKILIWTFLFPITIPIIIKRYGIDKFKKSVKDFTWKILP